MQPSPWWSSQRSPACRHYPAPSKPVTLVAGFAPGGSADNHCETEAIVNAVIHLDYRLNRDIFVRIFDYRLNRDIFVRIFDDRIEVESPGQAVKMLIARR